MEAVFTPSISHMHQAISTKQRKLALWQSHALTQGVKKTKLSCAQSQNLTARGAPVLANKPQSLLMPIAASKLHRCS
eukprot:6212275-Pleurochrysis_carterae.AAC.6